MAAIGPLIFGLLLLAGGAAVLLATNGTVPDFETTLIAYSALGVGAVLVVVGLTPAVRGLSRR